jgi:hypothetical protein
VAKLASNMSQVSMYGINGMVNGMVFGWLSCTEKFNVRKMEAMYNKCMSLYSSSIGPSP